MFAEELQVAVCPRAEVALTWTLTASGSSAQDTRAKLVLQFREGDLNVGAHGSETIGGKRNGGKLSQIKLKVR